MIVRLLWLVLMLVGCVTAPVPPEVQVGPAGVAVSLDEGVTSVTLTGPDGAMLLTQQAAVPVSTLELRYIWPSAGEYRLDIQGASKRWRLDIPVEAQISAEVLVGSATGQSARQVRDGDSIAVWVDDGAAPVAMVWVSALRSGLARLDVNGQRLYEQHVISGQRERIEVPLGAAATVSVQLGEDVMVFRLDPHRVTSDDLAAALSVEEMVFPATAQGGVDLARPANLVRLPSEGWSAVLRGLGWSRARRDPMLPWSYTAVDLVNRGDQALDLVLRLRILDEQGEPAPPFRARLRGVRAGQDEVTALIRVPKDERVTATLPVYVDEGRLSLARTQQTRWQREVSVFPVGSDVPIRVETAPLFVRRGSSLEQAGLAGALVAALGGVALVWFRGRRWLAEHATSGLLTIGLFSSLTFLVSAFGRLLTMGFAGLMGPFATFFTGLVDDTFRYALLATLVTLLPRPGTMTFAVTTTWLLSGVMLGSLGPTDVLFLSSRILFLETSLWLFGITRTTRWLEEGVLARWCRLALGFGVASLCATATGIALHMTLFRLYYADWYIGLMLLVPGFIYVLVACGLAVPFAGSLRRIQR